MTKIAFALAAAVLAGATMTNAANAGVRLGFGFPLGSFVAHSNENYGGNDYRRSERPRTVRRDYQDDAQARKVAKIKRAPKVEVADAPVVKAPAAPAVQTAKLEDKLSSDPATTTEIEKTPASTSANETTTGSIKQASTTTDKTDTSVKADTGTTAAATETKHVCRRYSAAIAGLVDVPCE
ncbi:hypothetical protein [Hyphomicrobium facile]|uniref:Uncharacterized protein n=1 Tax=Hyphomicrobium facile TaxID=51670 RepID=A0A1I7NGI7_9HYPH|nr:hypothetical protein [Hyphomicrobium facile]SFV33787.1 hypothetical protein SAMN04488557_2112 [Hyphomicrobium facile]